MGVTNSRAKLQQKVNKESGLPVSWAVASNKLISKVATNELKPKGQIEIPFGFEKPYLAPLGVMKLPSVGKESGYKFLKMGVETIKTLLEIPVNMLQTQQCFYLAVQLEARDTLSCTNVPAGFYVL